MGLRTPDIQTPLMLEHNRNPTVIQTRINEVASARAALIALVIFYTPQVTSLCAAIVVNS